MELIADRFVIMAGGAPVDLATGVPVRIEWLPAVTVRESLAWAAGRREGRRDLSRARLVDFGIVGDARRFEAWTTATADRGDDGGSPAVVRAVAAIVDAIEHAGGGRPRTIAVYATDAADVETLVQRVAACARRRGFVPVSAAMLTRWARPGAAALADIEALLGGRSLLVVHDQQSGSAAEAMACAVLVSPRPHIVLTIGQEKVFGADTVILGPARTAPAAPRALRAAEHGVAYEGAPAAAPVAVGQESWTGAGDVVTFRRLVVDARAKLATGRSAAGERLLRKAIGALTRRRDWAAAGDASNALARALVARGRAREAMAEVERGREALSRVHDDLRLVDTALVTADARLLLAKTADAEATFAAALSASRAAGDPVRAAHSTIGLARTVAWQGRYAEAHELLAGVDAVSRDMPPARDAAAIALAGLGRTADALAVGCGAAGPGAAATTGLVRLVMGDTDRAAEDLEVASRGGDRLVSIRSRLLLAEAHRRLGRRERALAVVGRFARVTDERVPPLVRAHVRLMADLLQGRAPAEEIAERHARATGLAQLRLYAPQPSAADGTSHGLVAPLVEILEACQAASDEQDVLADVCRRVRAHLHAAATSIYVRTGTELSGAAHDGGGRVEPAIALRAIDADVVIPPHQLAERVEAAAPIRFAGRVLGALAVRWPLGSPYSRAEAPAVLATAAAAAAPAVAVVGARRQIPPPSELLGASATARDLREAIERAAPAPFPVLVTGESGSGKELVARALHRRGRRRDRPFCTVNCAALPDDLLESELFGHARGAFTGAVGDRTGVFEEAHLGTLFLDEVGELSPRAQAKLLRVIQDGELRRVGENVVRKIDVRLVTATNRDLVREVRDGRFRADLLYRLDVIRIAVAPLRDRREDIAVLAEHYWREAADRVGTRAVLSTATIATLASYDWPGNVRELQNVLASLAVRVAKRGVVPPSALPPLIGGGAVREAARLDEARRIFEERFIRAALARAGGRRVDAAAELGLTRQGLAKIMGRLGITE